MQPVWKVETGTFVFDDANDHETRHAIAEVIYTIISRLMLTTCALDVFRLCEAQDYKQVCVLSVANERMKEEGMNE